MPSTTPRQVDQMDFPEFWIRIARLSRYLAMGTPELLTPICQINDSGLVVLGRAVHCARQARLGYLLGARIERSEQ